MFHIVVLALTVFVTGAFVVDGNSKWDNLRVTWGPEMGSTQGFYDQMPRTVQDAVAQGFHKISDCNMTAPWRGQRYMLDDDFAVILLYDVNGFIAGIQTSIPINLTNGYPYPKLKPLFVNDGDRYTISAYFTDPGDICTKGRTKEQFDNEGTGVKLYLQLSQTPEDSVVAPMTEGEAMANTVWMEGKCFPTMGKHFWHNLSYDMPCEEFYPIFLMYNKGRLNSFGWVLVASLTSPRYEHPNPQVFNLFMSSVPKCFVESNYPLSATHIYMTDNPMMNLC